MAITTVSSHVVSVNAIQGTLIADNAITAVHIATNAVSGTLIADNAVTATHIAQNTITVTQIADDAIEAAKLADGIITTNHLNKAMISSQTEVTPVAGDFVLIGDTSDSNNLKKAPISGITALVSSGAALDDITTGDAASTLATSAGNITIDAQGSDTDIIFKGTDGSSDITALTLDMSNAGAGNFNSSVGLGITSNFAYPNLSIHNSRAAATAIFLTNANNTAGDYNEIKSAYSYSDQSYGSGIRFKQVDTTHGGQMEFMVDDSSGNYTQRMTLDESGNLTMISSNGTNSSTTFANMTGRIGFDTDYSDTQRGPNKVCLQNDGTWISGLGVSNNSTDIYTGGAFNFLKSTNADTYTSRYNITSGGKHEFMGVHQGDTIGHFVFSNQTGGDGTTTNCTLMVRNGNAQVQIMPWSSLGARVGTRGGGWNSNSNNACYLTSNDASNIILNTNGSPTLADGTAISSDERLKKNITDIASGQLAKINALKPRNFEWKDSRKTGKKEGFIAQEVATVIPEAVEDRVSSPDPDDTSRDFTGDIKVLKHEVINARLIKAVQELSAELDAAKARISALEG